jgi:hypothetical protein
MLDDKWKRLSEIAGLPDAARPELENILWWGTLLIELDSSSLPPNATRKRLAKMRRRAQGLWDELRNCGPDVLMALVSPEGLKYGFDSPWHQPRLMRQRQFDKHVQNLDSLVNWLGEAKGRLPAGQTGDKTAAADVVTREIAELLSRHTGHKLTPSEKASHPGHDLVVECFRLLKLDIKAMTAIRRLSSKRRGKVPAEKNE